MGIAPALIFSDSPGALPAAYQLPPGFDIRLDSIAAMFDGSGASEDFYPCLAIYSQDNKLIGRFFPAQALASGDTAEVTFAPFLGRGASAAAGDGIKFETFPQSGKWLYVDTDHGEGSPNGYGLELVDKSAEGIHILERFGRSGRIVIEQQDDTGILLLNEHDSAELEITQDVSLRPAIHADVELKPGGALRVLDASFTIVFSVDEDGTIFPAIVPGISFDTANSGATLDTDTSGYTNMQAEGNVLSMSASGTTVVLPSGGAAFSVQDNSSSNLFTVQEDGSESAFNLGSSGALRVADAGAAVMIEAIDGSTLSLYSPASDVQIQGAVNTTIYDDLGFEIVQVQAGKLLGFYGAAPVTQPATPVTLADVIAALQSLGLVA